MIGKKMRDKFGVSGHIQVWSVDENTQQKTFLFEKHNTIQVYWANVVSQLLRGNSEYVISKMYMQYENILIGSPTIPTFTAYEDASYYTNLTGTKDYIRSSLIQVPQLGIVTGYENYFVDGESGNQLTFYAQTSGTTGENGLAFSSAAGSKVCGMALVATPTPADQTQDIVFARTYFDAADAVAKTASSQVGVSWTIKFTI
jgi:hypothetical protein